MFKKAAVWMLAVCLLAAAAPLALAAPEFTDIERSYAKDAILKLAEQGIVTGTGDGKFDPAGQVAREDFAVMLAKALRLDLAAPPASPTFEDVPPSHYSYAYVEAAAKAGLLEGMGNGLFGPNAGLTREQMAVAFARVLGPEAAAQADKLSFADRDEVSSWARDAVASMAQLGLLQGYTDGTFRPKRWVERQQAALVLARYLEKAETPPTAVPSELPSPAATSSPSPSPTAVPTSPPVWFPPSTPAPTPTPSVTPTATQEPTPTPSASPTPSPSSGKEIVSIDAEVGALADGKVKLAEYGTSVIALKNALELSEGARADIICLEADGSEYLCPDMEIVFANQLIRITAEDLTVADYGIELPDWVSTDAKVATNFPDTYGIDHDTNEISVPKDTTFAALNVDVIASPDGYYHVYRADDWQQITDNDAVLGSGDKLVSTAQSGHRRTYVIQVKP